MLFSLGLIFLTGILLSKILGLFKIPDVVSMIFSGILLSYFGLIDDKILKISSELRQIALVIILTRAGLSLDLNKVRTVGKPAFLLSFIPAMFEILAISVLSMLIFKIPLQTSLILGATIAAVSPAIVVPRMLKLQNEGYCKRSALPELIMSGSSLDDIFVIVLFYTFINLNFKTLFLIPLNIILGVIFGLIAGFILNLLCKKLNILVNNLTIIILSTSFVLLKIEDFISFSSLLSIMVVGIFIYNKNQEKAEKLSQNFNILWSFFSFLLFTLVGASINLDYAFNEGFKPVILILLALVVRSIGTFLCIFKSKLNKKEKLYCIFSYLPKATVQAAIGSIPLSLGLPYGNLILTFSVISILVSAPLGAFLMDFSYKKLLNKTN